MAIAADAVSIESAELKISEDDLVAHYRKYREALKSFFEKRRFEGAEDLVQTVFLHALTSRPRARVEHPSRYLFGIARNILHSEYRRSRRERTMLVRLEPKGSDQPAACNVELAQGASEVLRQELTAALEQLPQSCQITFIRSRGDGWSYKRISAELGVSTHTIKKYMTRTLTHLRRSVCSNDFVPLSREATGAYRCPDAAKIRPSR